MRTITDRKGRHSAPVARGEEDGLGGLRAHLVGKPIELSAKMQARFAAQLVSFSALTCDDSRCNEL